MPALYQQKTQNLALNGRREALDVLRGLAALLIFYFHFTALYPAGQVAEFAAWNHVVLNYFAMGVPLFYALSGASLYIGYFGRNSGPHFVADFYIRRLFRIAPLFYAAALAWFLIFYSRGATPSFNKTASTLSFLFNLMPGYHESLVAAGWSVGVEILFYAVFPIVIAIAVSVRSSLVFLLIMCAVAIVSHKYLLAAFPGSTYSGLSVLVHGQFFVCGILTYFLAGRWLYMRPHFGKAAKLMPLVTTISVFITSSMIVSNQFAASAIGRDPSTARIVWVLPIMLLIFTACIIRPSQRWLTPFAKLGEWSFSLYLLHPLVLYFVFEPLRKIQIEGSPTPQNFLQHLITCLVILIVVSAVTYRWIEKPSIDLGRRLALRAKTLGATVTLEVTKD